MNSSNKSMSFLMLLQLVSFTMGLATSEKKKPQLDYFWHVTDIHLHEMYDTYGDVKKNCRPVKDTRRVSHSIEALGKYGDYNCDSPKALVLSALKQIKKIDGVPAFILWSGGTVPSDNDEQPEMTNRKTFEILHYMRSLFVSTFQPDDVPVFVSLGRGDFYPAGKHTLNDTDGSYKGLSEVMQFWFQQKEQTMKKFPLGGFFDIKLPKLDLRIVSLNTNFFLRDHIASTLDDPDGQWEWLTDVLQHCKDRSEKAILFFHVPPGIYEKVYKPPGHFFFHPKHNKRYLTIIRKYHDVIMGQFGGHHHEDVFRVLYSNDNKPVSWIFIAPSLSPRFQEIFNKSFPTNPAIRRYTFTTDSLQVIDYEQYYLNIRKARSLDEKSEPVWEKEYSFRDYFAIPDITPGSLNLMAFRLKDNPKMFERYYKASLVGNSQEPCKETCTTFHICGASHLDYTKFFECISESNKSSPLQPRFLLFVCVLLIPVIT